ncbi:Large exoproteins involved in heme utilization or adhesion [Methylophaga frappieri]|uniref:Large exoproteins involved in heme utilization or adhesion n=1 Tax=Methylophaga frappieri (strain ATCC BAA-2434 / DSM 25690 / JAM7) TaxID=754477 RepID=I1YJB4_METFJ|nr:GLUG motif-containing protein [Methylophaga frappieri]AFJ03007.1 Large exoproteins involved in heme utilization or adhesion [Methylophaga frappieri]
MNHIYTLIWNAALGLWQVTSELQHTNGKRSNSAHRGHRLKLLATLGLTLLAPISYADTLPSGGNIVAGNGDIHGNGTTLNINQHSDKLAIDWDNFSIGKNNAVNFHQPDSNAAALNRVTGHDISDIRGALNANGRVFLINANGINFSETARVDVGSLVASTLPISTEDFLAGNYTFAGNSSNAVVNHGNITTINGGTVAMIAAEIINTGNISTPQGHTLMGAGSTVVLDLGGPVKIEVKQATLDTYIEQGGAIRADGGLIYLTAKAASDIASSVINHTGITEATTLATGENGQIFLMGDMQHGTVKVAGTLDASAKQGDGGFIETSAANVNLNPATEITTKANNGNTGNWLIDPTNFTIEAGAGTQTDNSIGASELQDQLANNNVEIETVDTGSEQGDITVAADVSWDANTTLTLTADNDIAINNTITATDGGLTLNAAGDITTSGSGTINVDTFTLENGDWTQINATLPDFAVNDFRITGGTFIRALSGDGSATPYQLTDIYGVQGMATLLDTDFALANNIDASSTVNWHNGAGFVPVGDTFTNSFTGSFDGLGNEISNLTINRSTMNYVGLFGHAGSGSTIKNIGVTNANINGNRYVGTLAGQNNSTISNSYATGTVTGTQNRVGGLVGENYSTISNSYATGTVSGANTVGGLVGYNGTNGTISNSYATGTVTGTGNAIGGLVGINGFGSSSISNSYATGTVSGANAVGGLVGYNDGSSISNSYATGEVSGSDQVGGVVGIDEGTIENSFWNTQTSGQANGIGLNLNYQTTVGLTTAEMFDKDSFTGFDLTTIWANADNQTTPYLRGLSGNQVFIKTDAPTDAASAANKHYTVIQNVDQLQAMQNNLAGRYALGNDIDASGTVNWHNGVGFDPVGETFTNRFTGSFDGLGNEISGLTINRSTMNYVGLFGYTSPGTNISNIGLTNADITGASSVGALVGVNGGTINNSYASGTVSGTSTAVGALAGRSNGTISNSYATGTVSGLGAVGGLVGVNSTNSSISNSYATGTVTSVSDVGGLVGINGINATISNSYATGGVSGSGYVGGLAGYSEGNIENSHATGTVSGTTQVGGLVGGNDLITISDSYATGEVSGIDRVGGLVGYNYASIISNSYATGAVSGTDINVGGLVGANGGSNSNGISSISNSYATGTATGTDQVGGLVGFNGFGSSISNSYATGAASGTDYVGGLAGVNSHTISNSYATGAVSGQFAVGGLVGQNLVDIENSFWDTDTTGTTTGIGENTGLITTIFGKTTAEMQQLATFTDAGWDIDDAGGTGKIWRIYEGHTTPLLRSFLTPLNIAPDYDGTGTALPSLAKVTVPTTGVDSTKVNGTLTQGDSLTLTSATDGQYTATANASGLYSTQDGYDITYSRDIETTGTTAGNIQIDNGVEWTDGHLIIQGNVTDAAAIQGGTDSIFTLENGDWTQINATLPDFAVNDFRITGGTFIRALSGDGSATPYQLTDIYGVQGMATLLDTDFALANNIDASGTVNWHNGAGFVPVGDTSTNFTGSFDGLGNEISSLTINRGTMNYVGLFGRAGSGSTIKNIGVTNANIKGYRYVGTLAGQNYSTISNSYATGTVTGTQDRVGGLVGENYSTISNSYATGTVSGANTVGGLVGYNDGISSTISNSYATGTVSGTGYIGGLVGENTFDGTINNSYATGTVSGANTVGGLAGYNDGSSISNSYATGEVSGSDQVGGVVGIDEGTIENSFWNTQTSGQANGVGVGSTTGVTGKTTAEMQQLATFTDAGWDIDDAGGTGKIWRIYEGHTAPLLRSFLSPLTANISGTNMVEYNGTNQFAVSLADIGFTPTDYDSAQVAIGADGRFQTASKDVGSYTGSDLTFTNAIYSTQQGYDLTVNIDANVSVEITPKALTLSGIQANNKVYDGTTSAVISGNASLGGLISGDSVALSNGTISGSFADKNVGMDKAITVTGYGLSGADAGNYRLAQSSDITADITPKALTLNGIQANNKVYDGTTSAVISGNASLGGLIAGDNVALNSSTISGSFADKNVGTGKAVNVTGYGLAGVDAANYRLAQSTGITANITPKALILTAINDSKIYDGTTLSSGEVQADGLVAGDSVAGLTQVYDNKNAGTGKTLSVVETGYTVTDTDSADMLNNYAVTYVADSSGVITPKALTLTAVTDSKTYDGTTLSSGEVQADGLVAGDSVAGLTQVYDNKNAGTGKTLNVVETGYTVTDADSADMLNNYAVTYVADSSGVITPKALILTAVPDSKTYDGSTVSGGVVQVDGLVAGDSAAGMMQVYDNNAIGTDKTLSVVETGYSLIDGDNADMRQNYSVSYVDNTSGVITPLVNRQINSAIASAQQLFDPSQTEPAGADANWNPLDQADVGSNQTDQPDTSELSQSDQDDAEASQQGHGQTVIIVEGTGIRLPE